MMQPFLKKNLRTPFFGYMVEVFFLLLLAVPLQAAYADNATMQPSTGGPDSLIPQLEIQNGTLGISLADTVYLTIRNNVNARTGYLDRVLAKFDLKKTESKFEPNVNLDGSANIQTSQIYQKKQNADGDGDDTSQWNAGGKLSATQKIPTGAELKFIWDNQHDESLSRHAAGGTKSTMSLTLEQPLLKGAGTEVNRASIELARLSDQINILSLRDSLSSLINEGVDLFYNYVQASENLEIQIQGLKRSKRLLEINRVKVSMGRMAASDMIQAEADVAARELQIEEARNTLDGARRSFLNHLELDPNLGITPLDGRKYPETSPNYKDCMELALKNNLSYLNKKYALRTAQINYMLAKDDRKWDLRAGVGVTETVSGVTNGDDYNQNEWVARLRLEAPINFYGDDLLARKRRLLFAEISERKAELQLNKAKLDLQTKVANAVRNVNIRRKLIKLATNDRELKKLQLQNEQAKLMAGRSANFQVVTYQDQLLEAERNEVSQIISYVRAITTLDQILGTTMATWNIEFRQNDKRLEEKLNDQIRPLVWTWW